jgi:Na+-driven multidrug efflux pump
MSLNDEALALEYEQARQKFMYPLFISVTTTIGLAVAPLAFLVPIDYHLRIVLFFALFFLLFLFFQYLRWMYDRWADMSRARRKITLRIASRQQTTIVAEPMYTH